MTECKSKSLHFTAAQRRQVVADFDGGRLTTDAGVLLLREVDRQIGLIDAINDCIRDPRDPRFTIHEQREMLAQRIFSIALGYEDLNDQQTLRDDPALQTAANKAPDPDDPLASPSTLCRLENRISRKALARLSQVLVEQFLAAHTVLVALGAAMLERKSLREACWFASTAAGRQVAVFGISPVAMGRKGLQRSGVRT